MNSKPESDDSNNNRGRGLVVAVIVGYNTRDIVVACLRSLERVTYEPLAIIYVDNESPDGTLEHVHNAFPEIHAVASGGNIGYCGGNNIGMRLALEACAEFVLILNPDTVVCNPGFVTSLVDYLRAHPEVGKVGPRVFLREPGTIQNTIMSWPSIIGSLTSRFASQNFSAAITSPCEVSILNGCCALVRATAIREVGLYDEEYWGYGDEAEWDWRAERAGWKRHFVPVNSIVHHQKKGGYEFSSLAHFLMKRNTALWFLNAGKPLALLIWITATSTMAFCRVLTAPIRGQSLQKYSQFAIKLVRAYAEILWRLITGKKRSMESLRSGIPCHRSC
jgi:N-acetylglucosaminyl-diphospho-decaprenol L-rhamnosyltransferase